jgi:hypothetical protein
LRKFFCTKTARDEQGIVFGCGGCGNSQSDQMQVITYHHNEVYDAKKEREKRRSLSTPDKRTIYLPFGDF